MPNLILIGLISGIVGFISSIILYFRLRDRERIKEEAYFIDASLNGGKWAFFISLPVALVVAFVIFLAKGATPIFGFLLGVLLAVLFLFIGERGILYKVEEGYFLALVGGFLSLLFLFLTFRLFSGGKGVLLFVLALSLVLLFSFFRIGKGILSEGARLAGGFSPSISRRGSAFSTVVEPFEALFASFAASYLLLLAEPARGSLLPFLLSLVLLGVGSGVVGFILSYISRRKVLVNILVSPLLFLIGGFFLCRYLSLSRSYFLVLLVAILFGVISFFIARYYTGGRSVGKLVESSRTGSATNIITGFALGLGSTFYPILLLSLLGYLSYRLAGSFGIALSALSLSLLAPSLSFISLVEAVEDNLPRGRGSWGWFFLSSSLAVLSLIFAYPVIAQMVAVSVISAKVVVGLFAGGALSFFFVSSVLSGVSRLARRDEAGKALKVSSLASYAGRRALIPVVFALIFPPLVGFLLGRGALGGMLFGLFASGVLIALMMFASGGAWEQAAKAVAEGEKKDEFSLKGATDGAIVGSPLARVAAPAVLNLMKLTALFTLFVVMLVARYGSFF